MNNDHLSLLDIQGGVSEYRGMKDENWNLLLRRIKGGRCTPFLGTGSCSSYLTLSNQIAQELAKKYNYPLPDINNLPRLAQFLAIERGNSIFPKEFVIEMSKEYKTLSFRGSELPHSVLAELPLPIYSIFRKHICNYLIFNQLNSNFLWTTI